VSTRRKRLLLEQQVLASVEARESVLQALEGQEGVIEMAKYTYFWKTTDTGKRMAVPLKRGREFEKAGMLKFLGKFKLGMLPDGSTGFIKVKKK